MSGKHIELFLVDGVPGGITTAEIAGWTGHVLSGPRSDIADVLARSEAQRNGAYFLLGDDAEALGGTRCYIGRTESFSGRFRDHRANKDFWDRVVIITSKDESFNEGHWGYLESRLVDLAETEWPTTRTSFMALKANGAELSTSSGCSLLTRSLTSKPTAR